MEWFETRFPRIAVNFEKVIRDNLDAKAKEQMKFKGNRNQNVDFKKQVQDLQQQAEVDHRNRNQNVDFK